ncbi:MAG: hypothetical protein ABI895_43095 [Deltaproteobacteria bacterium]
MDEEDAERQSGNILLLGEPAIHRQESLERGAGESEELPVVNARPSTACHGFNVMADQECG